MVTNKVLYRVVEKEQDHVDGTPLMRYTYQLVFDPQNEGRSGETVTKYYANDPRIAIGKICTL